MELDHEDGVNGKRKRVISRKSNRKRGAAQMNKSLRRKYSKKLANY
jgi:hypothetical protein